MGRSLRIDAPGAWHHVMNRGAGRRVIFRNDVERSVFVSLIAEMDRRFGVEIHAYCLMGNHYHLLVRSRSGRLSESMAWLGSQFTRSVNAGRGVDGAVFRGRFHSVLVQRESHLDWLFRSINANPLDVGWTAPLVDYPWSGLSAAAGRGEPQDWLYGGYVRERFGADPDRLERFVEGARSEPSASDVLSAVPVDQARIAIAVATARAPGPAVNSDADVRAATTFLELAAGVPVREITTVRHLDPRAAARSVERMRKRCERPGTTSALVGRATSLLTYESGLTADVGSPADIATSGV